MTEPPDWPSRAIHRLRGQFEAEWNEHTSPRIEDYLTRIAPTQRDRLLQELLVLEIEHRIRRGESPRLAEYEPRFPAHPAVVKAAFQQRQLEHENIVKFLDANHSGETLYLAMSYVEETDAARLVCDQGPLSVRRAARMTYQLLLALAHAHARGFVHRDIKPANLLVSQEGAKKSVKLADFGLARIYQESRMSGLTMEGDLGGTIAFLAPEQVTSFRGTPPSADQYSAAATLYNLLTGQLPFDIKDLKGGACLNKILQEDPVPILQRRPDLPETLAAIIHRALARDPADRFPDVNALKEALKPFV